MAKLKPTDEQQAIIDAAVKTKYNLLIEALAGAAKTSTLVMIAEALSDKKILSLAFNKKIADEMRERLPTNCTSATLNSIGYQAWRARIKPRCKLNKSKAYETLKQVCSEIKDKQAEKEHAEDFMELLDAVKKLRLAGWIPDYIVSQYPKSERLINDTEAMALIENEFTPYEWETIAETVARTIADSFLGIIDFDDQLFMPTCFPAMFPLYHTILVDEAQDLSPLNHKMLQKLNARRYIAVGDSCQAIYAFRGAFEDGMSRMRETFSMETLNLTTSFRCPEAIVEHVRWRAPLMKSWDNNPNNPGEIRYFNEWSIDDIPDDCAIICRNNAPLFTLALSMLRSGRYPELWGNDIALGLLKIMKKLSDDKTIGRDDAQALLFDYQRTQEKRVKNTDALDDKINCILAFTMATETLGEAIELAEKTIAARGNTRLMTGHKAKGHEFETVFFLNSYLLGEDGQDPNVRYVIVTRTQQSLNYIDSKNRLNPADIIADDFTE